MHQAICPKRSYCDASFDENCCFLVLLRKPFDSQPVTNVLPEQSCQEMWLLHMLSFSACSTETVSTHFGLILSHLSSLGKFSFSLKWRKKLSRAPGIDSYDLLIKCSETDEELGMEDNMDYFENENEKKSFQKDHLSCFYSQSASQVQDSHESSKQRQHRMKVSPAPRHSAALTPQPLVLVTDVRICLISEDGS